MKGPVAAGRCDDDGAVIGRAENLGGRVDGADIEEPARTQLELVEALAIGPKRYLIVDARDHVAEMRRGQILLRDRLEVEDI